MKIDKYRNNNLNFPTIRVLGREIKKDVDMVNKPLWCRWQRNRFMFERSWVRFSAGSKNDNSKVVDMLATTTSNK